MSQMFSSPEISPVFAAFSWISFYLRFLEFFGTASLLEALAYLHGAKAWDFNAYVAEAEGKRSGRENLKPREEM